RESSELPQAKHGRRVEWHHHCTGDHGKASAQPLNHGGRVMALSLAYTRDICNETEKLILRDPEIEGVFSIVGFGAGGTAPNQAILYSTLRPFEKRKGEGHNAAAVIQRLRGSLSAISGAMVVPFNPPAVFGLGQFGGFTFELE